MKIRLEADKTTIRLGKDEFQNLTNKSCLSQETLFPDGNKIKVDLVLADQQELRFEDNVLRITLPTASIVKHKPSKFGLTFDFDGTKASKHQVLFEVDIKKPPLKTQKTK